VQIDTLLACGGLSKNKVFIQEHANIVGMSLTSKLTEYGNVLPGVYFHAIYFDCCG
jgi:ribulose kinase